MSFVGDADLAGFSGKTWLVEHHVPDKYPTEPTETYGVPMKKLKLAKIRLLTKYQPSGVHLCRNSPLYSSGFESRTGSQLTVRNSNHELATGCKLEYQHKTS